MDMEKKGVQLEGFEDKLKELERVVEELESGGLSLAESLNRFESGVGLARECEALLKDAQQRVEKLIEENGELRTEPFGG